MVSDIGRVIASGRYVVYVGLDVAYGAGVGRSDRSSDPRTGLGDGKKFEGIAHKLICLSSTSSSQATAREVNHLSVWHMHDSITHDTLRSSASHITYHK